MIPQLLMVDALAEIGRLRAERDLESERLLSSIHEREEMCNEAITEILGLKAEVEQLRSDLELRNQTALDRKQTIAELEAEIERLRANQLGTQAGAGVTTPQQLDDIVGNVTANVIRRLEAEIERLRAALQDVVTDVLEYERINHLHPNPGRKYCWDSIERACAALRR